MHSSLLVSYIHYVPEKVPLACLLGIARVGGPKVNKIMDRDLVILM